MSTPQTQDPLEDPLRSLHHPLILSPRPPSKLFLSPLAESKSNSKVSSPCGGELESVDEAQELVPGGWVFCASCTLAEDHLNAAHALPHLRVDAFVCKVFVWPGPNNHVTARGVACLTCGRIVSPFPFCVTSSADGDASLSCSVSAMLLASSSMQHCGEHGWPLQVLGFAHSNLKIK